MYNHKVISHIFALVCFKSTYMYLTFSVVTFVDRRQLNDMEFKD